MTATGLPPEALPPMGDHRQWWIRHLDSVLKCMPFRIPSQNANKIFLSSALMQWAKQPQSSYFFLRDWHLDTIHFLFCCFGCQKQYKRKHLKAKFKRKGCIVQIFTARVRLRVSNKNTAKAIPQKSHYGCPPDTTPLDLT